MASFEETASQLKKAGGRGEKMGKLTHLLVKLIVLASLLGNWYLIGLLRHSPNSYSQLKSGGTAAYPGTVTRSSASTISIKTTKGTKTIAVKKDTPYALFPKDYQTLIPIGLPSSKADVVVGKTEASVSAQLPYLKAPQALRINLVRSDVLTGKVIELTGTTLKFKGFAATGAKEESRSLSASATVQKLGTDGKLTSATTADITTDMGLYAFLSAPASDATATITKLIVADFSAPTAQ